MTHGVYLYGILPPPGPETLALEGLDRQPVQTHALAGFSFLYSTASQAKYLASRRNLLSHERVLEQVMEQGYRTVLPLRFGLVIEDWQKVVDQLVAPYGGDLEALFERLEGRREVSIKIFWDSEAELQLLLAEKPELARQRDALAGRALQMDEVIAIGQALEAALGERRAQVIGAFRAALAPLAVAEVESDLLTADMIYSAAFLIPWDSEPAFSEAVEAVDARFENRLRIRYNHFTAPFHFAQLG